MKRTDLTLDVTGVAGLGETATIAATVHLPTPDKLGAPPIVCFAKPGARFSREYFAHPLPGGDVSQAEWHADRGWVFVSIDHLGAGDSSTHESHRLDYTAITTASLAAERVVLDRLEQGTVDDHFPPLRNPVVLGIGKSMGGSLTVVQQGRHHCYDGIAVLGYSVVHSHPPAPPGATPLVRPWRLRDVSAGRPPVVLNAERYEAARRAAATPELASASNHWLFFYGDVDLDPAQVHSGPWASPTVPLGVTDSVLTPGVIAPEAAAVEVHVLVAMGERDIIADPKGEPRAYLSATSVDLYICPRMGHMHNFAGTRERLWHRIDSWGSWVAFSSAAAEPGG